MMAGYLFARAGVRTLVLEKHGDFLRDFRGDTVHPSTLDLFDELGLYDRLLERPHEKVAALSAVVKGNSFKVADFGHLPGRSRFIAMMPQWEFLDFLSGEAKALPAFSLAMESEATGLIEENGRVVGVTTKDGRAIRSRLVIAADGRGSVLRRAAGLPLHDLGAPIDVLWFRVPKNRETKNESAGFIGAGRMIVLIDRGDYWQCARVIGKGELDAVKALGLDRFRADVRETAPPVGDAIGGLRDWDAVKLLTVSLDRLERWHRPGLLAMGDAAHAMSPVGGVGINLAIQDAVATANILAGPLAKGKDVDPLLAKVQARREFPVKAIQALQRGIHRNVIGEARADRISNAPLLLRALDGFAPLRRIPARVIGLGFRREHIRSPKA
ncbi:FAD-dependent oxidoreductase [Sphingomonas sp. CGMCC 1.13654]|uniref:FAD-dependent oxidoreductase n=2 Tax=Sphingomonas chungangi TaxID=2683589 RepID=A0A838LC30_9SPHN|nr:FAD-dependent oxidoreductase [Sphingomonas chungangi]MVW54386.1 FAD-dependent oxidoreductase [Sphingomonas chungangi]